MSIAESFITHRVENQVPALGPYNAFLSDAALRAAVQREGGGWAEPQLAEFGALAGGEMMELGFAANENKPRLRTFDRTGERIDEVDFHPSYHPLMQLGMGH
ncbi:MAG: DNA alkylation response protein, partial [Pseudomonadota bacterium]|nr:DNA alkylation response protein [Pseudomonadota bacterium]